MTPSLCVFHMHMPDRSLPSELCLLYSCAGPQQNPAPKIKKEKAHDEQRFEWSLPSKANKTSIENTVPVLVSQRSKCRVEKRTPCPMIATPASPCLETLNHTEPCPCPLVFLPNFGKNPDEPPEEAAIVWFYCVQPSSAVSSSLSPPSAIISLRILRIPHSSLALRRSSPCNTSAN
jgi:hypothetical protein